MSNESRSAIVRLLILGCVLFILLLRLPAAAVTLAAQTTAQSAAPARPTPPPETSYALLGRTLTASIERTDWGGGKVTMLVKDAELPITAFAYHEDNPMRPCELMQIVTAAAALDVLGPDYRFTTELRLAGHADGRTRTGPVIVVGHGDPSIPGRLDSDDPEASYALLDGWARALRQRGIRKIQGDVIGDARAFDEAWYGPGWPLDRLGDPLLPAVSALNFNHNAIDILWRGARRADTPAAHEIFPGLDGYYHFANNVRTVDVARQGRRYERPLDTNVINAIGEIGPRERAHDRATIDGPARFFAEVFRRRLLEAGIEVTGGARSSHGASPGDVPDVSELIDTHTSEPLLVLLDRMVRHNLTLNAEAIFKTLGTRLPQASAPQGPGSTTQAGAPAASFQAGTVAVDNFLGRLRIASRARVVLDGSGQSRLNRLSASQLMELMTAMRRHPHGHAFRWLFPRAGNDGPLAGRFLQAGAEGLKSEDRSGEGPSAFGLQPSVLPAIQAIAGSADGCEALAGWAQTPTGRSLAFVVMVNDSQLRPDTLRERIDALALQIAGAGWQGAR